MDAIEIQNLKKYYGKSPGIQDVTFSVREGELFGFVGPNGAGKSTTIRVLLNFLFPTAGQARIMGLDVSRHSKRIKAFTSYVPSDVRLYADMTVAELLRATSALHGGRGQQEAERLCALFEIDRDKRFGELSTGNRKKTAIVSALMAGPRVLILDEPTGGLDPVMQKKLFAELKAQVVDGLTVLLSSHNLAEVQEHCDRVAFIKSGRIVAVTDLREALSLRKIVTVWSDAADGADIPGAELIERAGQRRVYRYAGAPGGLLRALSDANISDFTVEHESLEDRFMSMYGEEVRG